MKRSTPGNIIDQVGMGQNRKISIKMIKEIIGSMVLLLCSFLGKSQEVSEAELFKIMRAKDSLMFNIGFNTCDISQFEKLVSENFEFYHDKGGITNGKANFVASIRDGLCKNNYKAIRKLDPGSMEVYPLYSQGKLYGAIQSGRHTFYEVGANKSEKQTSKARFTHLWLLENGEWKFTRGLSYDHKS